MKVTTPEANNNDASTDSAPKMQPIPEGHVPLHQLCDQCTGFFDNWELLDAYDAWQAPADADIVSYDPFHQDIKTIVFRNTAQLLRSHETCHFCIMMSPIISKHIKVAITHPCKTFDDLKNLDISFHASEYRTEYISVSILLGTEWCCKNLRISKYDREVVPGVDKNQCSEFVTGAFGPIASGYVPRCAKDNIQRVEGWVKACEEEHPKCKRLQPRSSSAKNRRPARILELSPKGVKLRCDVEAIEQFRYLTLSHVWSVDPAQQLRLISERLDEFKLEVPMEEMPEIFKEALRIARSIGFKHLWIDSLCIMQDSALDWQQQAS